MMTPYLRHDCVIASSSSYDIHNDTIGVHPHMLEVFLQYLLGRIRDVGDVIITSQLRHGPTHNLNFIHVTVTSSSYHIHIDAVGVRPRMLEVFLQPLPERIGDLMESDEFLDPQHLGVVTGGAGVQTLDDRRDVTEDTGVHQCYKRQKHEYTSSQCIWTW